MEIIWEEGLERVCNRFSPEVVEIYKSCQLISLTSLNISEQGIYLIYFWKINFSAIKEYCSTCFPRTLKELLEVLLYSPNILIHLENTFY